MTLSLTPTQLAGIIAQAARASLVQALELARCGTVVDVDGVARAIAGNAALCITLHDDEE
jgi:hypothetical protein